MRCLVWWTVITGLSSAACSELATFQPVPSLQSINLQTTEGSRAFSMNITKDPNCTSCVVKLPIYSKENDIVMSSCEFTFHSHSYDRTDVIQVLAKRYMFSKGTGVYADRIIMSTFKSNSTVYAGKRPNSRSISISIADAPHKSSCNVTGNLYIRTLDGCYYDFYDVGTFVFYKSKSRTFEVQIRTWTSKEKQGVYVCAVVVQEVSDVIAFDMCQGLFGQTTLIIAKLSPTPLAAATKIARHANGKDFKIYLPSGAVVGVSIRSWYGLSVMVQAPPADFDDTSGLCGYFDGNGDNDFMLPNHTAWSYPAQGDRRDWWGSESSESFSTFWRVHPHHSLFKQHAVSSALKTVPAKEHHSNNKLWCNCKWGQPPDCGPDKHLGIRELLSVTKDETDLTSSLLTPKEYQTKLSKNVTVTSQWSSTSKPNLPLARRVLTPGEWNKYYNACQNAIETIAFYDDCRKLARNVTMFIDQCIRDYAMTRDDFVLQNIKSVFEQECKLIALTQQHTYGPGRNLFHKLQGNFCPGQCQSRGVCTNGICSCFSGFIGSDCSIVNGTQPIIKRVIGPRACDRPECRTITVVGENFVNNEHVMGMVEESVKTRNMTRIYGHVVTCDFVNVHEIICPLPPGALNASLGTYTIRLSNNGGKNFNTAFNVTRVEKTPDCVMCTHSGKCTIKSNFCLVDSVCYSPGIVDAANKMVCDSSVSTSSVIKIADGGWGMWTAYGKCTTDCGHGRKVRTRKCDLPKPTLMGRLCDGEHRQEIGCFEKHCPLQLETGIPLNHILFGLFLLIILVILVLSIIAVTKCVRQQNRRNVVRSKKAARGELKRAECDVDEFPMDEMDKRLQRQSHVDQVRTRDSRAGAKFWSRRDESTLVDVEENTISLERSDQSPKHYRERRVPESRPSTRRQNFFN